MGCAATTTIREAHGTDRCLVLPQVGRRHNECEVCSALASLEQLVEAAQRVIKEYDEPVEGTAGASETELDDRVRFLAAVLAAVGPGEETA